MEQKSFIERYNLYCKESKVKSKVNLLDNNTLEINADHLDYEDWKPIIKALKAEENNLHCVAIRSQFFNKEQNSKLRRRITEPIFLKENLVHSILEAIKKCIISSELICSVCLEGFPLSNDIEILNSGISFQNHLQHLGLPYCRMSDDNLILLCRSIYKHPGLQTVDLTGCGITYKGAKEISAVIRSQKLVRYGETWKQSLRYRLPQPDVLPGLQRITLNNNDKIGDDGFKVITYELLDDLWIKAVDFQNCGLTHSSIENVLDLIKTNSIIKILDIRRNNIPSGIVKNIMDLLNKNTNDSENYSWINNSNKSTSLTSYNNSNNLKTSFPASRTYSYPNTKANHSTLNTLQSIKNTINNNKAHSNPVICELKETKFMLRKVSTCLLEEKIKREAIEKEHTDFKQQIEEIRSCLKQHNKINKKDMGGKNATHSTSKEMIKQRNGVKLIENNKKSSNKNIMTDNGSKKISEENTSNNCFDNHSLKSTKVLLMIPVTTRNKYINPSYKKLKKRSKSSNTKGIKNHNNKKISVKSEPHINKRKLKSTLALNHDQ